MGVPYDCGEADHPGVCSSVALQIVMSYLFNKSALTSSCCHREHSFSYVFNHLSYDQVGCIPCMLYPASGGTLDWTLGEAGIPYRCQSKGYTKSINLTGIFQTSVTHKLHTTQPFTLSSQLWNGAEGHWQLWVHPPPRADNSHWRRSLGFPYDCGEADHSGVCSSVALQIMTFSTCS